jgi:small subunit ribosomal protein S9
MTDITETEVAPEAAEAPAPVARAPRGDRPIQTVGRRKEAIVRVRIVPGTGKITCNGRDLEAYFPSKVHQQLIKDPLVTAEKPEQFDVIANLRGGGITGQAGALRLGIARRPPGPEEGRLPHPGRPGQGEQEVRSQEGP